MPDYPYRAFDLHFCFPICGLPDDIASDLLRLSLHALDAEYGYCYKRDDFCSPTAYTWGVSAPLDYSALNSQDAREISDWRDFVNGGSLWTGTWPLLRDLFQVNLISERHTSKPIEGLGYLTDWIAARPGRGRLEDLGRGRWLWTLTDGELFNTRPLLHRAGLLKSCHDRVYRDLPGAPPWIDKSTEGRQGSSRSSAPPQNG